MNEALDQIVLERFRVAVSREIAATDLLIEPKVTLRPAWDVNCLIVILTGFLYGERIESGYRKWPKTWWDAFKERWFPVWACKRWPVVYTELTFDIKAIYQKFRPKLPNNPYRIYLNVREYTNDGEP